MSSLKRKSFDESVSFAKGRPGKKSLASVDTDVDFGVESDDDDYVEFESTCLPASCTYPVNCPPEHQQTTLGEAKAAAHNAGIKIQEMERLGVIAPYAPHREVSTQLQAQLPPKEESIVSETHDECVAGSPSTPRTRDASNLSPRPIIPYTKNADSLFKALKKNSIEEVRTIFRNNPDAVSDYFWDNSFEPVLCAAVRLKCSTAIIQFLIEQGADRTAKDKHGRTAYDWLCLAAHDVEPVPTFGDMGDMTMHLPQNQNPLQPLRLEPWQCQSIVGIFMLEMQHLLSTSFDSAQVDRREAWRRKVAIMLEVV